MDAGLGHILVGEGRPRPSHHKEPNAKFASNQPPNPGRQSAGGVLPSAWHEVSPQAQVQWA